MPKPKPMRITRFFEEVLGAKPRNPRAWGAVDSFGRIFFKVWKDRIDPDGQRLNVALKKSSHKTWYKERLRHFELIKKGAPVLGVECISDHTDGADRKIKSFDTQNLLKLGRLVEVDGDHFMFIEGKLTIEEILTDDATSRDVGEILRSDRDSTTKKALIDARRGQGKFRTDVLQLWDNRCAVTDSTTRDAIRASHIKPWSKSTDDERLNPSNGLPLVATLDALFDRGLISFQADGSMIVSPTLTADERQILGLNGESLLKSPSPQTIQFLAHHRTKWQAKLS